MAGVDPPFYLQELNSFDLDQLRRIAGYLQIHYVKKTSKKRLVELIWDVIKPPPTVDSEQLTIDGQPVSVKLLRMRQQSLIEGDIPNEW